MKRKLPGASLLWLIALVGLLPTNSLLAQTVTFSISGIGNPYEGCEPHLVTFSADISGAAVDSVEVWVGTTRIVRHDDWLPSGTVRTFGRNFDAGTYNPILKIKTGTTWKDYLLTAPILVYSNPVADYEITSDTAQCFKDNEFCFSSLAVPGKEGHKLTKHFYDFGDGAGSNKPTICHSYPQGGNFDIVYTVTDEKGCNDVKVRKAHPEVYNDIGARFTVSGPVGCPCTEIKFNNRTPFDTSLIDHWIWNFGTSGKKSVQTFYMRSPGNEDYNNWWTGFTRKYCSDGYKSPSLTIVARDGCEQTFILKDAIRSINFKFDIVWLPDTPCFTNNSITFIHPPRPNATQWTWTFGDPASQQLNVNRDSWSPSHQFVGGPGFYNISLAITEPPCPTRDTTICFVKLRGPSAAINLPPPPEFPANNCVDPREVTRAAFEKIKYDECYRASSGIQTIDYVWVDHRQKTKRDSYFVYCNANIDSYAVSLGAAGDDATACGPNFYYAEKDGWVSKPIFNKHQTKDAVRTPGITKFIRAGDTVFYDQTSFIATIDGFYSFLCDSFYFKKGDTIPRNPYVIDSIPVYEAPDNGVNGNWRYRYNQFSQAFRPTWDYSDPIPVVDSLQITDSIAPIGGGPKVYTTFWVHEPYLRAHKITISGVNYLYRIVRSPIKHKGGLHFPAMYAGTLPPDCDDEWRTMHDSDKFKFDCKAPNLVTFKNNSLKYRLFGRDYNTIPTHGMHDMDNMSAAFIGANNLDSCRDNINYPWASDSMYYLWNFGDDGDQCTTYYDASRTSMLVKGSNPSGDPLRCLYSEIAAPQHLYATDGCWTAMLTVYDPVNDCESSDQQPIVMQEPDGGPADPEGFATVDSVNYYNQPQFQKDQNGNDFRKGVELGRGAAPCVGNAANPYFQRINIAQTIPLCGRETFWMIFNRDNQYQGKNDDPTDNDCNKISCTTDGAGKIVKTEIINRGSGKKGGTYNVEWRDLITPGVYGTVRAKGVATISNLGFLQSVNVRQQTGGIKDNGRVKMVIVDSANAGSGGRPIIVYGYEEVDTFYYECGWIPEMILQLIGMRWSYGTAGCKTPGIVIKVGDCFDTFFYENYRYFIDANGEFLVSPNPRTRVVEETDGRPAGNEGQKRPDVVNAIEFTDCIAREPHLLPTKLPYPIILSVKDYRRNDTLDGNNRGKSACLSRDSLRNFKYFIVKSASQNGFAAKSMLADSLLMMPDGYMALQVGDTKLVNLRDTVNYLLKEPGKYIITSTTKAQHGADFCFGGSSKEIWLGQHQAFRYDDSVLCNFQTVTFNDSVYYWHPGGQVFCELNEWWENTTCIDSNGYFYNPDSSAARYFWYKNIAGYTGPLYKEMIAWDFDAQRYLTKADGTDSLDVNGLRIRMEDYQRVMDSANIEVWINPADSIQNGVPGYGKYNWDMNTAWRSTQWTYGPSKKYGEKFGVGVYDVTLWARDSMGCWTPNTKQNAVRVLGVRAFFGVCDTCNTILVCTPSSIEFKDTSEIIENKEDVPSGRSVTKGKMDSVVYWSWDFGDERDTSILQNPIHTYLDAHDSGYTVRLKVKTMQGCEDEITKKFYIKIIGPQAKFFLPQDVICVNDSAYVIDSSSFEERTQSYWTTDPVLAQAISDFKKRRKVGLYFDKPGKYNITVGVSAKVNDPITGVEKQCLDVYPNPDDPTEDTITVTVRDYDPFTIKASDYVICPGEEIIFSVVADSTYTGYNSVVWNMGLENSVYAKAVAEEIGQVYAEPGKYSITAIGLGDFPICPLTDAVTINVKEVKAEIEVDERSNEAMGNYVFLNRSLNALYSRWRVFKLPDTLTVIHEETYSDSSRFVYVDFTEGEYMVELLVSDYVDPDDARACTDRAVVRLIVEPILQFYNVITPNGDGVNDWWEMQLQVVPEWELTIYNRWGAIMMRADQDDELECYFKEETQTTVCKFWDGTNRTEGGNAAPGTYFFVFKSRFKGETEMIPANGTITLVR